MIKNIQKRNKKGKNMETDTKIVERIQKLLNLSNTNDNPHEAALALSRAQELLQKYNLSMAEIGKEAGKKAFYIREFIPLGNHEEWRRKLASTLAKYCFCEALFYRQWKNNQIVLIGEKDNIAVFQIMFTYIQEQLDAMAKKAFRKYRKNNSEHVHGRVWKMNFYFGALFIIRERLEEEKQNFAASANDCKALIVIKEHDLREAIDGFYGKVKEYHYNHQFQTLEGMKDGVIAGRDVRFHREINNF